MSTNLNTELAGRRLLSGNRLVGSAQKNGIMQHTVTKAAGRRQFSSESWGRVKAATFSSAMLVGLLHGAQAPAQSQSEASTQDQPAPSAQRPSGNEGEQVYMQYSCFVCHGQQGFGGIGPAFRNDPFLRITDYVTGQIILGRGVMPPFGDKLNDKQIAAVASYIRNSWGNHFGPVKPEEVAQNRHALGAAGGQAASPSGQTTGSAPPRGGSIPPIGSPPPSK